MSRLYDTMRGLSSCRRVNADGFKYVKQESYTLHMGRPLWRRGLYATIGLKGLLEKRGASCQIAVSVCNNYIWRVAMFCQGV